MTEALDHSVSVNDMVAQPLPQRTAGCTLCGYCTATGEKIQAAQPVREPLSNEQIKKGQKEGYDVEDWPESWAFREGVKFAERAHGIGRCRTKVDALVDQTVL